jgi:lipoate-protein ligase A
VRLRFLVDEPGEGAFNMAVDETLFLFASESSGEATVRLYGFRSPTVSLGYRQNAQEAIDLGKCRELGVDCVKRPTGGRALLHQHELTYSVASPFEGVFRGLGVRSIYDALNGALRSALAALGVPLDAVDSGGERDREPALSVPCLAHPSRHEIASGGRKLVASAQRRGRSAFLQHGSILRRVDTGLWARLSRRNERGSAGLPGLPLRAVGIDELLRESVPGPLLVSSLRKSFEELFETEAEEGALTGRERESVAALREKYRAGTPIPRVDNVEAVW